MQEQTPQQLQYRDDEIDLRELFATLWAGRWIIIGITALFAIVSIIVVLQMPNQYKSTVVLAPAQISSGSLEDIASQFGGLASLAGINIGGGGKSDDTHIAMEIMQSWGFIEQFIKDNNIEVEVFAAVGWDRVANKLKIDSDLYAVDNKKWVRESPKNKTVEPTSWELFEEFSEMLSVSQDRETRLVSLSIEYFSPIIAKQWVDSFVSQINEIMKQRKLNETSRNIKYLQEQIQQTSIVEMKEVFYQIVEEQTKTQMLAEASPEYAFVTVNEAMVAEEKSTPRRALIVIIVTALGVILGVVSVFFVNLFTPKIADKEAS